MSNDLRGLLHDAAIAPATEADVTGAWRRGRRLRFQRRAVSVLAIAAIVGLGSLAIANIVPNDHGAEPVAPITTAGVECFAVSTANDLPSWTASANASHAIPHRVSPDGNVAAIIFGDPLSAGSHGGTQNKILWIVRQARGGQPLEITATLPGSGLDAVRQSVPANSGPGEIYPSIVDVPKPGCWHFSLAWNGHRAAIDLGYGSVQKKQSVATTSTTTPTATTATTPLTSVPSGTTCRTADLSVSLGQPVGSAGHLNYEIAFRNNGAACAMTGFPGVSFLDAAGQPTGNSAARNSLSYAPVDLAPGATAYAHLSVNDLANPPCTADARSIRVYPPNETHSVVIATPTPIQMCGTEYIDPVLDHPLG